MQIGNHEIIQILENQSYETNVRKTVHKELGLSKKLFSSVQSTDVKCSEENASLSSRGEVRSHFNLTVGDAKSTSTLRGVRNRAPDEFGSFKEVPGDFHTQAYVMECLSRISGPGGFFYTIRQVLGRLKVTPKSFVDIFKEGNYERNMDALNDYFWGLCFAAVISFVSSDLFPDNETLSEIQSRCGNVNDVLLEKFKVYLEDVSQSDNVAAYHSNFITTYGPLLLAFHESVRYGNAKTREACWLSSLVLFCLIFIKRIIKMRL